MIRPLPNLERIAAEAARLWQGGGPVEALAAVIGALRPRRVLEIGSSGGRAAEAILEAAGDRLETYLIVDPDGESVARARRRLAARATVRCHHAALRPTPDGAPHFTRHADLVAALCEDGFDLVLLAPAGEADALYADLAQAVPLLRPMGVLLCQPLDGGVERQEALAHVAAEGNCRAVLWELPDAAMRAALLAARAPGHTHEEARVLRRTLPEEDPVLAAALARGDHDAVVAHLRRWLAHRLGWSTPDLLLPLGALPPALSVLDVVEQCDLGEGGVGALGAAVTLAMLYRAFGYPATVYPHGVPGVYTHVATLVGLPDGRILLEDALFDAEPRRGAAPLTWEEVVVLARTSDMADVRLAAETPWTRPHLYSRGGLAVAEAGGWLTAAERRELETAMASVRRVLDEPRAALAQAHSTSLEAFTAVPARAASLARLAEMTGIVGPLELLALPFGPIPLTGDARCDREIARVVGVGSAPAAAAAEA